MKELVEMIAKNLVENPDKVKVTEIDGERIVVYELRVDKSDLGKVIGKEGKTARAMRTILTAISLLRGKRAVLEILE